MNGLPTAPATNHAHFNPVQISRTVFEKGKPPQTITEQRHMTFNVTSYRRMCEAAGIDLNEMSARSRKLGARRDFLTQKHGQQDGLKKFVAEQRKANEDTGAISALLPSKGLDSFQQTVHIVWGALIAEDAGINDGEAVLTLVDVEAMMSTAEVQAYLFASAADSLMWYLYGKGLDGATKDAAELMVSGEDEAEAGEPGDEGNVGAPD